MTLPRELSPIFINNDTMAKDLIPDNEIDASGFDENCLIDRVFVHL